MRNVLRLISTFCLVFTLTAHAGVKLVPHRVVSCSALLLSIAGEKIERGELRYQLNGMSAEIFEHLRRLETKSLTWRDKISKTVWALRPNQVLDTVFKRATPDRTTANDVPVSAAFRHLAREPWRPQTPQVIEAMLGRIRQLEEDFGDEAAQTVSVGIERRGAPAIRAYLTEVEALADRLDGPVTTALAKEQPYWRPARFFNIGLEVSLITLTIKLLEPSFVGNIHNGFYLGAAAYLPWFVYIGPTYARSLKRAGAYFGGAVSPSLKNRVENAERYRATLMHGYFKLIRDMAGEPASDDSFIYQSHNVTIPESLVAALNEAYESRTEVNLAPLLNAVRRERLFLSYVKENAGNPEPVRHLLSDQFFYFDEQTKEPVLVTFVRLKRSYVERTRKKAPPETATERGYDPLAGFVPGVTR